MILDELRKLQALNQSETQLLHLAGPGPVVSVAPEAIYCSRCGSTDTTEDNDILLCDNLGCHRAYHQQCQTPVVETSDIPEGDELWYCQVCLAVFNSLKAINSAFSTTFETVDQVFPDLSEDEDEVAKTSSGSYDTRTESENDSGDDQEDEDFELNDAEEDEDEDENDAEGDGHDISDNTADTWSIKNGDGSPQKIVADSSDVSDDELHYLSKEDVIDSERWVAEFWSCTYLLVCTYWQTN